MQILLWLFKLAQEKQVKDEQPGSTLISKEEIPNEEKKKKIVCYKHFRVQRKAKKQEQSEIDCNNFKYLAILFSKGGNSRAYFYNTLHQKRLTHSKMNKQDHGFGFGLGSRSGHSEVGHAAHRVGNKVLPITESSTPLIKVGKQCQPSDQKKGNRGRKMSRMKELLRWAAAAKSDKSAKYINGRKVLQFRNIQGAPRDDHDQHKSPKMNTCSRWVTVERSSAISPAATAMATATAAPPMSSMCVNYKDNCASKIGNWITTDDEFVVLEL